MSAWKVAALVAAALGTYVTVGIWWAVGRALQVW